MKRTLCKTLVLEEVGQKKKKNKNNKGMIKHVKTKQTGKQDLQTFDY